jgi:hypothetical protein
MTYDVGNNMKNKLYEQITEKSIHVPKGLLYGHEFNVLN